MKEKYLHTKYIMLYYERMKGETNEKRTIVKEDKQTACIFNIQKFSIHDGPGIRTVVFFKGCPLRCYWCANPESQQAYPEKMLDKGSSTGFKIVGNNMTIDEIMKEILSDLPFYEESGGGVTLSGGEVLYQATAAIELLRQLKKRNIHTASETTGYAKQAIFSEFIQYLDFLYFDVKHYDEMKHLAGTGVSNQLILENLRIALAAETKMLVRIPIIPGFNNRIEDARGFSHLFKQMGVQKVELLPFHQFGEKKYEELNRDYQLKNIPQLHTEDLDDFKAVIQDAGISCQVQ